MERTDHVLAERVVDPGLAADRRVDLSEQRRRDLDERHSALVDRRGKSRQVADDSAAERDHASSRVRPAARGDASARRAASPTSCASRHRERRSYRRRCPRSRDSREAERAHHRATTGLVTMTARGEGKQRREERSRVAEDACADPDGVAALAERDLERSHLGPAHAMSGLCPPRPALLVREVQRKAGDLVAIGLEHEIGDFPIERIALRVQLDEPRERVGGVEQRTMAALARALAQRRRARRAGRRPSRSPSAARGSPVGSRRRPRWRARCRCG